MGCKEWQDDIPATKSPLGIIFLLVNLCVLPGGGTMLAACIHEEGGGMRQCTLIIGVIQWLTAGCLIGWIWAIWWGIIIMQKQKD